MTGPPTGQVYELSEAEMKKAGWKDSVESVASYHDTTSHSRQISYTSADGASPEPGSSFAGGNTALTVPQSASVGHNRRGARSPLARVSMVRGDSNDSNGIELDEQQQQQQQRPAGDSSEPQLPARSAKRSPPR